MPTPQDAALAMAVAEARHNPDIRNHAAWIRAAANRYLTEHHTVWHALLQTQPGITTRQLVDAVTVVRDPLAGAREARSAKMAVNRARLEGRACPRCGGSGWWMPDGPGNVALECDCTTRSQPGFRHSDVTV